MQTPGINTTEAVQRIRPGVKISCAEIREALITTTLWEEMKAIARAEDHPFHGVLREREIPVERNVDVPREPEEEPPEAREQDLPPRERETRARGRRRGRDNDNRTQRRAGTGGAENDPPGVPDDVQQTVRHRLDVLLAATEEIENERRTQPEGNQTRETTAAGKPQFRGYSAEDTGLAEVERREGRV